MTYICVHSPPRTASRAMLSYFRRPTIKQVVHCHFMIDHRISHYNPDTYDVVMNRGKGEWKIVTIIRDPIERNLSDFYIWTYLGSSSSERPKTQDEFIDLFMQSIDHYQGTDHIQREIEPFWHINVYDVEYPPESPYQLLNGRLLIIHFDKLDRLSHGVSRLLHQQVNWKIPHIGKTSYRRSLMENLKLPETYVKKMLNHQYTQHFFTPEERRRMKRRWT